MQCRIDRPSPSVWDRLRLPRYQWSESPTLRRAVHDVRTGAVSVNHLDRLPWGVRLRVPLAHIDGLRSPRVAERVPGRSAHLFPAHVRCKGDADGVSRHDGRAQLCGRETACEERNCGSFVGASCWNGTSVWK